ncbi:DUF1295 domain-containing protein [bacterium]|nr:DUF1295 domain-containing protein [bacterium]
MNEENLEKINEKEEKRFFNEHYNISYFDENLPSPSNNLIFKHYISSSVIYAIGVLIILFNPFYTDLMKHFIYSYEVLIGLFLSYLIFAPIFLFTTKPKTVYASHSIEVINYVLKLVKKEGLKKESTATEFLEWLKPTYKQKSAFILYFIKLFFAPQLLIWTISHFQAFQGHWQRLSVDGFSIIKYRNAVYITLFELLYFLDCFIFAVGYCTELTFLKNRIRTVESSFLGLFFCLACYAPFSMVTSTLVPWSHSETSFSAVSNPAALINWVYYVIAIILIALYVAASLALFTKASNLTNRGTCKIFPFNIVRHPAYSAKVLLWWVSSTIVLKNFVKNRNFQAFILYTLCGLVWTFIYYMRAITEERHLSLDPEYREYAKKVKYKFIPYLW